MITKSSRIPHFGKALNRIKPALELIYNIVGNLGGHYKMNLKKPYHVQWDGTNEANQPVASGIYLYRLKVKEFVKTRKMILLH